VPLQSLLAIQEVWTSSASLVNVGFDMKQFLNITHANTVSDSSVINYIISILNDNLLNRKNEDSSLNS